MMKNNAGAQQPMISTPIAETCILVAEVTGDSSLVGKLGQVEADRAVERCRTRAARSIEAYQGATLQSKGRRLVAHFQRCDNAVLAAQDLRERVSQLPPVSGVSLSVRVGVHAGAFDAELSKPADSTVEFAVNMLSVAVAGQILLSREAAMLLPDGSRGQLDSQTQLSMTNGGHDTPLYELRSGTQGLREVPLPTAPAATVEVNADRVASTTSIMKDNRASAQGTAEVLRTRLMLRHQGSSFIVSETHPVLLAGREEGNDLVIIDRRASRQHTRIEWRQGRYVLIDSSTNGTYLVDDNGVEVILRRGECELPVRGRIGFGYSPQEVGAEAALFDIGQR